MWIVGVDCKRESEGATLVHAFKEISLTNNKAQKKKENTFIRCDSKCEVEEIGRIGEMSLHR